MTIGELFVDLGIRGPEKALNALSSVKNGLSEVQSSGLAAKASILAVIYGLEQLTAAAGAKGAELKQFQILSDVPVAFAQKWELAAEIVGGSADDIKSSLLSVQNVLGQAKLNKGAPEGLALLVDKVKDFDLSKLYDTTYVTQKARQYALLEHDKQIRKFVLGSFGFSDSTIGNFANPQFAPNKITADQILNGSDIEKLSELNKQWKLFWNDFTVTYQKGIASIGASVIKNIHEQFDLIKNPNTPTDILNLVTGTGGDKRLSDIFGKAAGPFTDAAKKAWQWEVQDLAKLPGVGGDRRPQSIVKETNNNVTVSAQITSGADPAEVADHLQRLIDHSVDQSSALLQAH